MHVHVHVGKPPLTRWDRGAATAGVVFKQVSPT
jgi:hypothetical protein